MIDEKLERALNEQLNHEFFSWYTYLGMSSFFEELNLDGFGHWMHSQAKRESMHAMKIYGFLHDQSSSVLLGEIKKPPPTWDSPLAAVEEAYANNVFGDQSPEIGRLPSALARAAGSAEVSPTALPPPLVPFLAPSVAMSCSIWPSRSLLLP